MLNPSNCARMKFTVDFIRSSGPGGQNVNKVATAVQLRFNVRETQSLSPEIRDRLIRMAGKRVNASGRLVIEARRFRTQQRNREDAMERLVQMIEKACIRPKVRHKSRPTAASNVAAPGGEEAPVRHQKASNACVR